MHERTVQDLAKIKNLNEEIAAIEKKIRAIKNNCAHKDYELSVTENFKYEFVPCRRCKVCRGEDSVVTFEEKKEIYAEFVWCRHCNKDTIDACECGADNSEELDKFVKDNPDGFNLGEINAEIRG